jgi:hypothetical protein
MSAAPKGQTVVFEVHPFYVCYKEKDGKYRLYKKNDDGTWPNQLGKSKEGYNGLQELQTKAKEKHNAYVKELESKNAVPPPPAPEEVKREELGKTFGTQVELTTDKADEEQAFSERMNQIISQSRKTGQDPLEILAIVSEEKDDLGNPIISAKLFNRLYSSIEGRKQNQGLEEIVSAGQKERRNAFHDYKNLPEDRKELEQSTMAALLNPATGLTDYQATARGLTEEERESLTPDLLHMINSQKKAQGYSDEAKAVSSLNKRLLPEDDFSIDWSQPTLENARKLYGGWKHPDFVYDSDKHFNEIGHGLAAAGHSGGSSSLQNNEEEAGRFRHQTDLNNIFAIQKGLESEHRAKGDTIGYIDKLTKGSMDPLKGSIELDENMHGKQADRDLNQFKNQQDLQSRITEGGMNLATTEMGEDVDLKNAESGQLSAEAQTLQNTNNMVYNYLMQAEELRKQGVLGDQAFRNTEGQIWAQRQNVLISLERLAQTDRELKQKVDALKDANKRSDKEAFMKILGTVAVTAFAGAVGGPVAAVGALTGSTFGMKGEGRNWLGGENG